MTSLMTPTEYLERHPVTLTLKKFGVTDAQLAAIRFSGFNGEWPFDLWSFRGPENLPPKAISHIKPYCALKWLIIENPPHSREKEDAWRLVNDAQAAPVFAIGVRAKAKRQLVLRKSRGKITDDGRTLAQIIKTLALNPDHRDLRAKELWGHLFAELDRLKLAPEEVPHPTSLEKCFYKYGPYKSRKQLTYKRFSNAVSNHRRKKSR